MHRSDLQEEDYRNLLSRIEPILLERGLKSTTMDTVAQALGMSKRTLYEIFDSKSEMLKETLDFMARQNHEFASKAFADSDNVIEALFAIFKYNRDRMGTVNVNFYRDMDRLYKERRDDYEKSRSQHQERMLRMFSLGVSQGMFRPDVDYHVQSRVMSLQMEALKRVEELFPSDISLVRVFDSIIIGFLRSIASEKGMLILDNLTRNLEES